jgi:hypothetical protein
VGGGGPRAPPPPRAVGTQSCWFKRFWGLKGRYPAAAWQINHRSEDSFVVPHGLTANRVVAAVGCLALGFLALAQPAAAQEEPPRFIEVDPMLAAEKGTEPWDVHAALRDVHSRFALFGEGDRAFTSLRLVGDNRMYETNTGPGDEYYLWNGGPAICQYSTQFSSGCYFQSFGIPIMWSVPRSEWVRYLVEGVESMQNVKGDPPGFSVLWNGEVFARPKDINAADGLVGTLLSGVVSTEDGSCRDHSAGLGGCNMGAGYQLLPGSNCPETWSYGGTIWLGDRPIPPDNWIAMFEEQGMDFRWNRWQVPDTLKDPTKFMGNNFATYGHFNDYNSTTLKKFGEVVPGGVGEPTRQGYPLGLDFYFDAFSFTIPTVANAKFWAALIVNNSEQLYGVAHDYDSIYWGIGGWPGRRQDGDNYFLMDKGAWVSAESSDLNSPECQDADPVPLIGQTCEGFNSSRPDGFEAGAHGIMILKSPIGDLRNKLFSTLGSPFYMPGHPLAGDTITYNHAVNWNFGTWGDVFNSGTDRMRFGVMSDTKENILDGSACSDFVGGGLGDRWSTFQSNEWPDGDMCKPKWYVPGDWQYVSGRPLGAHDGPDTLHLPGCGPTGCPETWRDTTWQGWSANRAGNLSQHSLGPFRLEAGDTAEIILAMYSGRDSVTFEAFTQGIYDFYLGLFQGPEAPPRVTIQSLDLGSGVTPGSEADAEVTLVWDEAAEDYVDPFMAKFADDMEIAAAGTELAVIRDANPGIVDRIRERAADNLEQLLIFRSCDGGSTFDADGDCDGDEAYDALGNTVEPGWQAYAILTPDASGDFPNTWSDGTVTAGVTYLYSILGQSRGFEEVVINDPNASVDTIIDTGVVPPDTTIVFTCGLGPCETTELVVAPPILNPLSRSSADPNVTSVYIPVSIAGGGAAAAANFVEDTATVLNWSVVTRDLGGYSTVPFDVALTSGAIRESGFEVAFGNYIEITEVSNATSEEVYSVSVVLEDLATTVVGDTGTTTATTALQTRTFTRSDGVPVTLNAASLVSETEVNDTLTRVYEIGPGSLDPDSRTAIGFVLYELVGAESQPLLASGTLTGDAATPGAFLANPGFPGFLVSADNSEAGSFDREFWMAEGDTLSTDLDPRLEYDQANSDLENVQSRTFGQYVIVFSDSVFGTGAPFVLRLNDPTFEPEDVDELFDASLLTRTRGTTAVTTPEAKALVGAATGQDTTTFELVAANLPFEVYNLTYGRTAEVAMIERGEVRKQLGLYNDTISVTVDADQWIPEDEIYVIEDIGVFRTRDVAGVEAIVVNEAGTPETETRAAVSFSPLLLTCGGANSSCNPVSPTGFGFGQWIGVNPDDELNILYYSPFDNASRFSFSPTRAIAGQAVIDAGLSIEETMDLIRVVPNPYVFFSEYEATSQSRRIMFTHLPPDGEIRIYTVAGNFVQEIDWAPEDLTGNGDLFWDMQTREGNEVGAGLFLYVITAVDPATGRELKKMGKFVVIR